MKKAATKNLPVRTALASAILLAFSGNALAFEFSTEDGIKGSWNNTVSLGANWRTTTPLSYLYSRPNGQRIGLNDGSGGTDTDAGNLNYRKGDIVSAPLQILSDLAISKGDLGAFVRVKAWYDAAMENKSRPFGNADNGYAQGVPLADNSQPDMLKYSGIALLDAYVYNTFDVGTPLQVRLGNQVVNWGESLFIQGINQFNPLNLPVLRKPGTEVKEAFLPVWSIDANIALGGGASLEAFYQFKWAQTLIDSCGGYYSPIENSFATNAKGGTSCAGVATVAYPGAGRLSTPAMVTAGIYAPLAEGKEGKDTGQYGLALRLPIEPIDSEMGLYGMKINSRTPFISAQSGTWNGFPAGLPLPLGALRSATQLNPMVVNQAGGQAFAAASPVARALGAGGITTATAIWEYPDNINIYGVTLSTNIAGWSVGAEYGYTNNQPVQINGVDMLNGLIGGVGPVGQKAAVAAQGGLGSKVQGYDLFNKNQLAVNTVKILPSMLGASQGLFTAEIAGQLSTNTNDQAVSQQIRYGRAFIYGFAESSGLSSGLGLPGSLCGSTVAGYNPNSMGCKNDGFVTKTAWGYRLKGSLDYPGAFDTSFTLTPSLFWAHDVNGYSVDSQFIKDRMVLGVGLRADYQKKFAIDIGYTMFGNKANYDPFADRDYFSVALSSTF